MRDVLRRIDRELVSKPSMPFDLVPIGTLCQALKFSMCIHDGQPVV